MDVIDESKRIFTLCQGCLSTDRKLKSVTGQTKALFIKLREDGIQNGNDSRELSLCWECIALVNKMKYFQARIKTAQYRLAQYLQTFFDNKQEIPRTLSKLTKTTHKEYDHNYKYMYEEEENKEPLFEQNNQILGQNDQTFEQKDQIIEQKDQIFEQNYQIFEQNVEIEDERLLADEIKIENNDLIKEEDNIDNDTDYYEPDNMKQELDEDFKAPYVNPKLRKLQLKTNKDYKDFATVTNIKLCFSKNDSAYYSTVYVSSRAIEDNYKGRHRFTKNMPFGCKLCNIGYTLRLDFLRHTTFNHNELLFPTNCMACRREIVSESHLEEHWRRHHNPLLRCSLCGTFLRNKGEVTKHLNRFHTKKFTCNSCSSEFRTLREFSKHYVVAHERVTCDYCGKHVSTKRKLETHIKKMHLPGHCSICNKSYRTYHVLELHIRRVHHDLVPNLMKETNKETRYCVECDKQYPTIDKYKRHLQQSVRHTPRKRVRIPCEACDKIFSRVTYKNNHYRLVHVKKSKHYCELCNKYFANGYGVRKHIQHVHQKIPKPKNKICDLCGRGFSSNRILLNHRRTHTGERPFKCPYCPASFGQLTAMKSHQKTQHRNV